jgi:RNA recognition motif-containing protein
MGAHDDSAQENEVPLANGNENGNGNNAVDEEQKSPGAQQQPQQEGQREVSFRGNEDRKIFVGGIAYDVANEDLIAHFSTYGEVAAAQVKYDRATGRSRGFAFVEFATTEACKEALLNREQHIKNKQCEIKPAKSREVNKKVFVGGLPADFPEDDLRKHFEEFGKVEDIEWPFDKQTKARRNFAFIVFEEEDAADRAANVPRQQFGSREADVKKAVPQNKRTFGMFGGVPRGLPMGAIRAYGGGMRGGQHMGMHSSTAQWFNGSLANGWMGGLPYAAGGGGGSTGWGDYWHSSLGSNGAANYYTQSGHSGAGYGAYGSNGFDHFSHQSGSRLSHHQQHSGAGPTHQHSGGGHGQTSAHSHGHAQNGSIGSVGRYQPHQHSQQQQQQPQF